LVVVNRESLRQEAEDMSRDPTQREIKKRCEKVRKGWSDKERKRREFGVRGGECGVAMGVRPWTPPMVSTPSVDGRRFGSRYQADWSMDDLEDVA